MQRYRFRSTTPLLSFLQKQVTVSCCKFHADRKIGRSRRWRSSVTCPCAQPPLWKTSVTTNSGNPRHFEQFDIEHNQWEELLYPFTNVKNLYLAEDVGLHTATALQGLVGGSVTQVLPALQSLFITGLQPSGPTWEAAQSFVAARQRFGRPIAIHRWEE